MKIITSVLFSALIGLGLASGAAQAEDGSLAKIKARDKLIVGVFTDKPPFGYVDEKGNYVGFDTDLGRRFAKDLLGDENKVEFVAVEPASRIPFLQSDKVDLILANMTVTPERRHWLLHAVLHHYTGRRRLRRGYGDHRQGQGRCRHHRHDHRGQHRVHVRLLQQHAGRLPWQHEPRRNAGVGQPWRCKTGREYRPDHTVQGHQHQRCGRGRPELRGVTWQSPWTAPPGASSLTVPA